MKVVLDLQGAQSDSRFRGIGRQALALAKALAGQAGSNEIWLALSSRLPEAAEALKEEFNTLVPADRIRTFQLPGPVSELESANGWRTQAAELIREKFLEDLRPDLVHVTSLFEGFHNEVVASVGRFSTGYLTAVTLHDLIPLLRPEQYMPSPQFRRVYLRRAQSLLRADLLLAVSESSRREAIERLQVSPDRVIKIGSGVSSFFREVAFSLNQKAGLLARLDLRRPFVLHTGGLEPRKNLEAVATAFGRLPSTLRAAHQLAVGGILHEEEKRQLRLLAERCGLGEDELVPFPYVSDAELRLLYNTCAVYVFPSLHEGFGLPVLEAMACGAAVLGANATSVPEIINRSDALFDPRRPDDLAGCLAEVLGNASFCADLKRWGVSRAKAFSWEGSARTAWAAFKAAVSSGQARRIVQGWTGAGRRPTLAFVSPLPPERTGIADYAARLLPHLARHYEITCIVSQDKVSDPWITAEFAIRGLTWFEHHAGAFDRVLYQMGNSPAHQSFFDLLTRHPGVLTLHDFFLSAVLNQMEVSGFAPGAFTGALWDAHGYPAIQALAKGREVAVQDFPANAQVLRDALGVVAHSDHAVNLVQQWYGPSAVERCRTVAFLPQPPVCVSREEARARLNIPSEAFVACSFGWLAPVKLNHRLVDAWLGSVLAEDDDCLLFFVGGNGHGPYFNEIAEQVRTSRAASQITITGYAEPGSYDDYLAAADVAIQLRTGSRGETSGTIFDCLARGVPVIINAHGTAVELPDKTVWKLPDEFATEALSDALATLRKSEGERRKLAAAGAEYLARAHHPEPIAERYRAVIEEFYAVGRPARELQLVQAIARIPAPMSPSDADLAQAAAAIAANRPRFGHPHLFLDVTHIADADLRTGIERAARGLAQALLATPGYRVDLVRAVTRGYVYARRFAGDVAGFRGEMPRDDPVETGPGDLFLGLDWCADVVPALKGWFQEQRLRGLRCIFMVHDLLPVLRPEFFPEVMQPMTADWLRTIATVADGIVCVSRTVADQLHDWLKTAGVAREGKALGIGFSHHGADLRASLPTTGLTAENRLLLDKLRERPSFLMVGTVEPRKGHRQALSAMERLWAAGADVNLVMIGKQGWMMETFAEAVRQSPEYGRRLFWPQAISDEVLEQIYRGSRALLAASYGEGFGLPLIEAAHYGLPIVARDLPVFREVAGEHAFYFQGETPEALAAALQDWLSRKNVPESEGVARLTWNESATRLLELAVNGEWDFEWPEQPSPTLLGESALKS